MKYIVNRILSVIAVLYFGLSCGNAAITLSGTAAQNLETSSGATVSNNELFLLVAAPSGTTNFSSLSSIAAGTSLTVGSVIDGDTVLYAGGTSSFLTNTGLATVSTTYDNSNFLGDSFALVWFPTLSSSSTVATAGASYGVVTDQTSATKWVLPSDNSGEGEGFGTAYTTITAPGAATDAVTSAVPEPSKSSLLLLGLLGSILRRRRSHTV